MVVLPALGGDTIMPRWPNPIGQNKSINRQSLEQPGCSSVITGCGSMIVMSSYLRRLSISAGSSPSTEDFCRSQSHRVNGVELDLFFLLLPALASLLFIGILPADGLAQLDLEPHARPQCVLLYEMRRDHRVHRRRDISSIQLPQTTIIAVGHFKQPSGG